MLLRLLQSEGIRYLKRRALHFGNHAVARFVILQQVDDVASTDATVLITGELAAVL